MQPQLPASRRALEKQGFSMPLPAHPVHQTLPDLLRYERRESPMTDELWEACSICGKSLLTLVNLHIGTSSVAVQCSLPSSLDASGCLRLPQSRSSLACEVLLDPNLAAIASAKLCPGTYRVGRSPMSPTARRCGGVRAHLVMR